jgi:hypothetical protein
MGMSEFEDEMFGTEHRWKLGSGLLGALILHGKGLGESEKSEGQAR